jgi:hypothetical protein
MTLNNLIEKKLETFASYHKQVNDFYFGDPWERSSGGASIKYPIMFAVLKPNKISKQEDVISFEINFCDKPNKGDKELDGNGTEQEVLSDMRELVKDFYLTFSADKDFIISETITPNHFTESFDDEVSGWSFLCDFKQAFKANRCLLPLVIGSGIVYSENFGNNGIDSAPFYKLPNNWIASSSGDWVCRIDSNFQCTVNNSSGGVYLSFEDKSQGSFDLITEGISTIGKQTITIEWNEYHALAYASSLGVEANDGNGWQSLSLTQLPTSNTWHKRLKITLPATFDNNAGIKVKFTGSGTGSNNFIAIDDFVVSNSELI